MRAMFILALLWSLVPLVTSIDLKKAEGCGDGKTYRCFVPDKCTDADIVSFTDGSLTELQKQKQITDLLDDCGAIIKFHQYQDHWTAVWIESFEPGITKVVLVQKDSSDTTEKSTFSCERSGTDQVLGKYTFGNNARSMSYGPTNLPSSDNLICKFDVLLNVDEKVFGEQILGMTDSVRMEIITASTIPTAPASINLAYRQCDPNDFKFVNEHKPAKVYDEVLLIGPGDYRCREDIYKMEYRADGSLEYEDVSAIKCVSQHLMITTKSGTIKHPLDSWVYIRCVADAEYFCKDAVKNSNSGDTKALDQVLANTATSVKGSLKCPDGYPHLFIEKQLPITNPTFACLNYGGTAYWTVNDNIYLTSKGPAVYCSATVNCNLRNKIPAKSIKGGYMGNDDLPKCHDKGVLLVDGNPVTNKQCDFNTGEFKFTTSKGEEIVTKDTVFECKYPVSEEVEKQNARNKNTVKVGSISAAVAVVIIAAVSLAVFFVVMRWRYSKEMNKENAKADAGYIRFSMTPEEKKIAREQHLIPEKSEVEKTPESINWNPMIMSFLYSCQDVKADDNFHGEQEVLPKKQTLPPKDATHAKPPFYKARQVHLNTIAKVDRTPQQPLSYVEIELKKFGADFLKLGKQIHIAGIHKKQKRVAVADERKKSERSKKNK